MGHGRKREERVERYENEGDETHNIINIPSANYWLT